MEKVELIYEGKAKKIYSTNDLDLVIAEFKDDLTAFNAKKKSNEKGKGNLNCQISAILFQLLQENKINNHFIKIIDGNNMLCKKVKIIPIEVVVRNVAAGSITKRFNIKSGTKLPFPLVEFFYKNDELNDPLMNDEHCKIMNILEDDKDILFLKNKAREINNILQDFFLKADLQLIDFKIEFGRDSSGNILLSDEMSPDNCRLWDRDTNEKMDKDIFRENLGNLIEAYEEVLNRIQTNRNKN